MLHSRVGVARMEPLAAESGGERDHKPGLRRKRLRPGYDTYSLYRVHDLEPTFKRK